MYRKWEFVFLSTLYCQIPTYGSEEDERGHGYSRNIRCLLLKHCLFYDFLQRESPGYFHTICGLFRIGKTNYVFGNKLPFPISKESSVVLK
ncbi:hypothetical protein AVEN_211788-1 [Araneus ventricosus]|uniref:Uncharacterized protein n=1 Tax=Araneus ventricosus TaxID=182803 RepID=A0A4Y2ML53_ARAVE|nr:hypothetical protein AVEN_197287-1 [Araneus ventricosus]GBN27222.1 hypothetical protein AVEN_35496-1 [Araneus ventricosus]GBN27248.1 hypothetical protein AVEN_129925-1 [Araneus ventricosus]GBN27301.1 hypothetical protein AVEN_211788-1 [Araneus ventricosus]